MIFDMSSLLKDHHANVNVNVMLLILNKLSQGCEVSQNFCVEDQAHLCSIEDTDCQQLISYFSL